MASKQVFISHISSETELAKRLKERLDRDFLGMLDIFVSSDRETIQAGARWLDEVDRALKEADLEIVLCSMESVGRPWVNFEAGAAWLRGIPVVPVCHSGLQPHELPVPLSMLQGLECGRPAGLEKLYDTVASVLGVRTPAVDFAAAAAEMRAFEESHRLSARAVEQVADPAVLCAASTQYAEPQFQFDLDVGVAQSIFGIERVTVERALTRRRLTELLTGGRFDIVHLVAFVEQSTGALVFDPIDTETLTPLSAKPDKLPAASFAALLAEAHTSLVVLATCNALLLAVEVAHVANMAASDTEISGEAAVEWADCFYGLLRRGQPVFKAFDITRSQVDAPIRAVRHRDVVYSFPGG
ncbi:MAG: toll/interleukin-1 receptor domain-containing protein [Acidimicrobiia bacterium]